MDLGRDCDRIVDFHIGEVPMGDLDRDRSTQRFRSGWIQLENYTLADLAGDLDSHELDPGSDLGGLKLHIFLLKMYQSADFDQAPHANSNIHVFHTCGGIIGRVCTRKGSKVALKACLSIAMTNSTEVSKHW